MAVQGEVALFRNTLRDIGQKSPIPNIVLDPNIIESSRVRKSKLRRLKSGEDSIVAGD
jgi:hypothetical protein